MKIIMLVAALLVGAIHSAMALELGFSGMAQIDANSYLVVQDKKVFEQGDRLGILQVQAEGQFSYTPLSINDWKDNDGQSSDLESVCHLPGSTNEYLVAESGYWDGKFGRIFQIVLTAEGASVKHVYHVPKIVAGGKGLHGDNFEGMACIAQQDSVLVVLGERGGSKRYKNGYLRIGVLDKSAATLSWQQYAEHPIEISAPGAWLNAKKKRTISDLYPDEQGVIWAVATEDGGDQGPFKSVIYQAATVSSQDGNVTILPVAHPHAQWVVDGFKVEALAGPAANIPQSYMSIGTEDESFGGIWRPLFRPLK
ncbi:hypothetical protein KDN34_07450 [Shewanella yunxiaonensis]|uniref:Uncharacterized protein n=1 Tax=Shewanella yunxiaonensis TaxID=2829809 RepID=A0ABX7YY52_9GAMM|nr:hypothetical protein [Shewanella yunxiaonensis]QUN07250.1 hypothetical protein KDN34_07450 [Shewanella yunxiaonensis]